MPLPTVAATFQLPRADNDRLPDGTRFENWEQPVVCTRTHHAYGDHRFD